MNDQAKNGFTLLELLVALAVFSLIAVAGVAMLRSSADGQIALKQSLAKTALNSRVINLLESDLSQAMPRQTRDRTGSKNPAFATKANDVPGSLFSFARGGTNTRVAYAFNAGALQRISWPALDGSEQQPPANLVEKVQSVTARFRTDAGEWRTDWDANDPLALPRAVELTLTPANGSPYRMVMLVGSQNRPEPQIAGSDVPS